MKFLDIRLLLQKFINVGSIGLPVESICYGLLISLLTQGIIDEVEIRLLFKCLVQDCEVFLERALIDALVEILAHFIDFLAHLTQFKIDFVDIALGQKNS